MGPIETKLAELVLDQLGERLETYLKEKKLSHTDDRIVKEILSQIRDPFTGDQILEYLSQGDFSLTGQRELITDRERKVFMNDFFEKNPGLRHDRNSISKYLNDYLDRINDEWNRRFPLEAKVTMDKLNDIEQIVKKSLDGQERGNHGEREKETMRTCMDYCLPSENRLFTGRETELVRLSDILKTDHMAVLSGISGTGKTQIAGKYVREHRQEYEFTVWIAAGDQKELDDGYWRILLFYQLNTYGQGSGRADAVYTRETVKKFLNAHHCLLVLDGADGIRFAQLRDYIPEGASTIITTQDSGLDPDAVPVLPVESFTEKEAVNFLLTHANRRDCTPDDGKEAELLAKQMGYHPLALEYARAYVNKRRISLREYRELYERNRVSLLHGDLSVCGKNAYTSWKLSFERVVERNPDTKAVLEVCSFLASEEIPFGILFGERFAPAVLHQIQDDLLSFSLIGNLHGQYGRMHGITQEFIREMLEENGKDRLVLEETSEKLTQHLPQVVRSEQETELALSLLPHEKQVFAFCIQKGITGSFELGGRIGNILYCFGRYEQAIWYLKQSMELAKKEGAHFRYAEFAPLLIQSLYYYGQVQEALDLCRDAVEFVDRTPELEGKSADYLKGRIYGIYGIIYKDRSDFERAGICFKKALECSRRAEDLAVQTSQLLNLGNLYKHKGEFDRAEKSYLEVLELCGIAGESGKRNRARALGSLGVLYMEADQIPQARQKFEEAKTEAEEIRDMQTVCTCSLHIAGCLLAEENKAKAEEQIRQALKLARELNYVRGQADIYNAYGNIHLAEPADLAAAMKCFRTADEISRKIRYSRGMQTAEQGMKSVAEADRDHNIE